MTDVIRLSPSKLPDALRLEVLRMPKLHEIAARRAANKLIAYLVNQSDERGITYQGIYKAGFRLTPKGNGVTNIAPHAPIVEEGARPHPVSIEARGRIAIWCERKLGLDAESAKQAAEAIAWKIQKYGQKGRYVMRDALKVAREFYAEEFESLLRRNAGR